MYKRQADGLLIAGPFDTGRASHWISTRSSEGDATPFRDFPKVNQVHVMSMKASSLTNDHLLAMKGLVDGEIYAVPLYELKTDPANGQISFRTRWSGGTTVGPISPNMRLDVVRP